MTDREPNVRRFGTALSIAVLFFAVCIAALLAHVAIDIAGDHLLPADTYDDLPHDSRAFAFIGAAALALGALGATIRLALVEARGRAGAMREALAASLPAHHGWFALATALATVPALAAMGALDELLAGRALDSLASLFGGSFLLGGALALACSLAVAALCSCSVRALARAHRRLVRAIVAFVRAERLRLASNAFARRRNARGVRRSSTLLARCSAGRAPPQMLHH